MIEPKNFLPADFGGFFCAKKNLLPTRRERLIPQQEMYEQCLPETGKTFRQKKNARIASSGKFIITHCELRITH